MSFVTTDDPRIQSLLAENGFLVRKDVATLARLPSEDEIGTEMETWVEKDGEIKLESTKVIGAGDVITRNPEPLSDGRYNEWPQGADTFSENYGTTPDAEFKPYKKVVGNKVIVIDDDVLDILGRTEGNSAYLGVSWGDGKMVVSKGDFLFDAGYGVNEREFENTYERI